MAEYTVGGGGPLADRSAEQLVSRYPAPRLPGLRIIAVGGRLVGPSTPVVLLPPQNPIITGGQPPRRPRGSA